MPRTTLRWKLYNRANQMIAATLHAEELVIVISGRFTCGDYVKFDGNLIVRFKTESQFQLFQESIDGAAQFLWHTAHTKRDANEARFRARVARTTERLRQRARERLAVIVVNEEGAHSAPDLAEEFLNRISD